MVHRDPETGQFLAHGDDEPVELTYADHEFLNFFLNIRSTGDQDASRTSEYQIESDVLDLENDELAMLSWLNTSMSLVYETMPETGGEVTSGGAFAIATIGANLTGREFPTHSIPDFGMQAVDEPGDVESLALNANDEPGIWSHMNATAASGYKDADADGSYSGGQSIDNDRMRRVFREETGGGPYIDATDDVKVGLLVNKEDTEARLRTVIHGQMSFVVFEYENRRAEFAPYDPGPSM